MKKVSRLIFKKLLKSFIRIDRIPLTKNGRNAEYCTMYVFGLAICSNIYPVKEFEHKN